LVEPRIVIPVVVGSSPCTVLVVKQRKKLFVRAV